jgi:hypothetical protein
VVSISKCYPTNQLTSWSRILLEKLIVTQLVNKIPVFHGTRGFITVFTTARNWSLSGSKSIQSTPSHSISLKYPLILSSYLRLVLQSGFFISSFPTKNFVCTFHFIHQSCMPRAPHHPRSDHFNSVWLRV